MLLIVILAIVFEWVNLELLFTICKTLSFIQSILDALWKHLLLRGYTKWAISGVDVKPFLMLLFFVGITCLYFFILNWKLWLFIALVYIFVKCLLTNFYEKHFNFKFKAKLWDKNLINILWKKRKILVIFFLKLLLFMLPIRILLKICAIWLFSNEYNTICSIIFIVLLCLPFVYYFLNIITKFLKKKKREAKDYFLFNNYVIENINLYNILYIISSIILIKFYFIYCFITILIIIIVLIISCSWCPSSNSRSDSDLPKIVPGRTHPKILLQAACFPPAPITAGWLNSVGTLGIHLAIGAISLGDEDPENHPAWVRDKCWDYFTFINKTIDANNLNTDKGDQGVTTTTNWLHKDISSLSNNDDIVSNMSKTVSIVKSPILRVVYGQKTHLESDIVERDLGKLVYKPQTLFANDKFKGSVGSVENTLVVNFLKNTDSTIKNKIFLATHYIHDDTLRRLYGEMEPIERTIKFLDEKYGIFIPNPHRVANIIAITEMEAFDNQTLRKVFRPCLNYTDLDSVYNRVEKYYQCKRKDNWDPNVDNTYIANKVREIKTNVKHSTPENDIKLNELYLEYFKTRLNNFSAAGHQLKIEPDLSTITTRGELFYKCTGNDGLTKFILFREDDSLVYTYNKFEPIDMTTPRYKLLGEIQGKGISKKCYALCVNQVSMELLCLENPNADLNIDDLPLVYSIVDTTNLKYNKVYDREEIRSLYNILNKRDGCTLKIFLRMR